MTGDCVFSLAEHLKQSLGLHESYHQVSCGAAFIGTEKMGTGMNYSV